MPALHVLSAALPLVFLNCGLTHFLVARDLGVLNMVFAGLMVPVNVVANVMLSRRMGAPGAAWSMLITEAALSLCCLLALYVARRQDLEVLRPEPAPVLVLVIVLVLFASRFGAHPRERGRSRGRALR